MQAGGRFSQELSLGRSEVRYCGKATFDQRGRQEISRRHGKRHGKLGRDKRLQRRHADHDAIVACRLHRMFRILIVGAAVRLLHISICVMSLSGKAIGVGCRSVAMKRCRKRKYHGEGRHKKCSPGTAAAKPLHQGTICVHISIVQIKRPSWPKQSREIIRPMLSRAAHAKPSVKLFARHLQSWMFDLPVATIPAIPHAGIRKPSPATDPYHSGSCEVVVVVKSILMGTLLLTVRNRKIRLLPSAFTMLTRVFVLFALVGVVSADIVHSHHTATLPSVAVQASGTVALNECCHTADQSGQNSDCFMSLCCTLMMLAGNGGRDLPLVSSSMKSLIGPTALVSRSHLPILHPPIAI